MKKLNAIYVIIGFGLLRFILGLSYYYFKRRDSKKEFDVDDAEKFWFAPDSQNASKWEDFGIKDATEMYFDKFKDCGGPKGCKDRTPDTNDSDCKECFDDTEIAMAEFNGEFKE